VSISFVFTSSLLSFLSCHTWCVSQEDNNNNNNNKFASALCRVMSSE